MKRIISKIKKDNNGSTMVEVLAGLIILVLIIAEVLVHIIGFSSKLIVESKDIQNDRQYLKEEIYKKDAFSELSSSDDIVITLTLDDNTKAAVDEREDDISLKLGNAVITKCESERTDYTVFNINYKER